MSSLPALSVTVQTRKRACVLDTHLVLSRYGLLLTQRLGEEFNLWLIRELWQILDDTQYYQTCPELLVPAGPGSEKPDTAVQAEGGLLRNILKQWESARLETDMAGLKVFWIGDALSESLLPVDADQNLGFRFETLARSLDTRINNLEENKGKSRLYLDCLRDAAALSATLIPSNGFILTLRGPEPKNEPFICSYLREWGISCRKIGEEHGINRQKEFIMPLLVRAGILELMWAGLDLAAVHLLVPEAIMMPQLPREENGMMEDFPPLPVDGKAQSKDWWEGAQCFWYAL